jgi:hypothetical protein
MPQFGFLLVGIQPARDARLLAGTNHVAAFGSFVSSGDAPKSKSGPVRSLQSISPRSPEHIAVSGIHRPHPPNPSRY